MPTRSEELASQFEQAVADFRKTVEACSDAQWSAVCNAEGWTVAQTAQHVSGQFPLEMEFITAAAEGKPLPSYNWNDINGKNDTRAAKNASASKADVLKELADGAEVKTQQLIEGGVLIDHVKGHHESIRTAG